MLFKNSSINTFLFLEKKVSNSCLSDSERDRKNDNTNIIKC